jgi:hypothetical protein
VLSLIFSPAQSQDVQFWIDGYVYKEFGNRVIYEANPGYNKLLRSDGWSSVYLSNTVSVDLTAWYMAELSVEVNYTKDPEGPEILEIKPFLGQQLTYNRFFESIHLDRPYFYLRYEQRFLDYTEGDSTVIKSRLRPRIGGRFILKGNSLSVKTWYIPFYYERFINLDGEAVERYANISRLVFGAGYVINSNWRTEVRYYGQRSRHNVEDRLVKTDMMFQLKLMYYIR